MDTTITSVDFSEKQSLISNSGNSSRVKLALIWTPLLQWITLERYESVFNRKFCVIVRSLGCSFVRSFPAFLPNILTHQKLTKFTNQVHIRLRWCVNYQNIGHFQPTRERPNQGRGLISYHKNTSCILPILSIHVKSGVTLHNYLRFFSFLRGALRLRSNSLR